MIDLSRLDATPLERDPFDYVVVRDLMPADVSSALALDFPRVSKGGSFPPGELSYGGRFEKLLRELEGDAMRDAVSRKFDIDLSGRPTMVTVRGQARAKDGRIHTDARWKLVTLLLYVNRDWSADGGHFRFLRSSKNMDDYIADVPPEHGTAVVFRCMDNAWHGHTPYIGERRAVQVNWVEDESWLRREEGRHRWSSKLKRLFDFSSSQSFAYLLNE